MNQTLQVDIPAQPFSTLLCQPQVGAVCWRMNRGHVQVLLITSRDTGRWVIPKGWPIHGLTAPETAAREAWEEAGVQGRGAMDDLGQFHYDKIMAAKPALPCQVQVFALRVAKLHADFPERKERRRKWFDAPHAARKVAEPELRQLLQHLPEMLAAAAAP